MGKENEGGRFMKSENFRKYYQGLCHSFRMEFNEGQAVVWFNDLKDYTDEEVRFAMEATRKTCKYQNPTLAEVISNIPRESVGVAWDRVLSVARAEKKWQELRDAEVKAISEIGGLQMIEESDDAGLPFIFNRFKTAYDRVSRINLSLSAEERKRLIGSGTQDTINRRIGCWGGEMGELGAIIKQLPMEAKQ